MTLPKKNKFWYFVIVNIRRIGKAALNIECLVPLTCLQRQSISTLLSDQIYLIFYFIFIAVQQVKLYSGGLFVTG